MRRLLVFAKQPVPGTVKTRLAASLGAEEACALYHAFVRDTADMLCRLGKTEINWWVDGDPTAFDDIVQRRWSVRVQPEGDLGGRLSLAFDAAFQSGARPVAVIGTDCPLLAVEQLEELFVRLEERADAVLVPAEDGGFAALGLATSCPALFSRIPWSTDTTLKATVAALNAAGLRVSLLETHYDVDDLPSFTRLLTELEHQPGRAPHTIAAASGLASIPDALGRRIPLAPPPGRILSLVPSMTECLFDAGLGDRVVGRTDYCISPADVSSLPSVGGPKSLDCGRVTQLAPDLVLANAEENDRRQVEELVGRGLRVHVAFPKTLAGVAALLRQLGLLLRAVKPFDAFARQLEEATRTSPGRRVRCACLIWKDPYMTATGDTLTSALLETAGGENVFAARGPNRYPVVPLAELAAAAPRVVLLPSEPYAFEAADARALEAAVPGATALRIPGEWVTWYGGRMAAAIRGLRERLDPFRIPLT